MDQMPDSVLEAAELHGHAVLATQPRALAAQCDATGQISIGLINGCTFSFPARIVQDLQGAALEDLATIEIQGEGLNLHWPLLDVDLYVPALVAGIFGTREWMARELPRAAGQTKFAAKSAAARPDGAVGGRRRRTGT